MKIYFAASITGGREHAHLYPAIVEELKRYGTVLSEHISAQSLGSSGEDDKTDQFVHDRDIAWVLEADAIVSEVTQPSTGVGYEIGRAVENNKPVLCLYRPQEGKRVTRMLSGSDKVIARPYIDRAEARKHIDDFFANITTGRG